MTLTVPAGTTCLSVGDGYTWTVQVDPVAHDEGEPAPDEFEWRYYTTSLSQTSTAVYPSVATALTAAISAAGL